MINFIDEKGIKHSAIVECKKTKGVNGEKSLSGTIYTNDEILEGIGRGWRLEFENEKYCLTYVYPIDEGNRIVVEFDAVHEFFFDLNKKVVYTELNGSNTAKAYLDLIFNGSSYSYVTEVNIPAFEKEGFGMRNRLDLFKEFISDTGVEFSVNGKVVRILEKVGSNLSTIVKKGFNLNELRIEKDPGSFITYKKGFGAWVDDDDHSKGRLEVEYLSPLASIYGKLEGDPIIDERYKVASNFETRLKNEVESSYGISVDIDMEDLTKAGYEYEQPHEGDYIMAINKDLGFEQKIRIMSYETSYDTNGNIIDHKVSCGSDNIIRKSIKEDDEFRKEIQAGLEGAISTSNKAWVSANGKNAVFEGPNEPTATAIGDIWYQIDGEEKIMRIWNGYEWKPVFNPGEIEKKVEQAEQEVQTAIDQSNTAINNASQAIADAGFAKNQSATALTQAGQAVADAQSVLDAFNNLEIGGRNLAIDSNHSTKSDGQVISLSLWGGNIQTAEYSSEIPPGLTGLSEKRICTYKGTGGGYSDNDLLDLIEGETYTVSYWAKSLETSFQHNSFFVCLNRAGDNAYLTFHSPLLTNEWNRFSKSFTVPYGKGGRYRRRSIVYEVSTSWISHIKIEKGNVATDWSPAPEDIQVQITNINGELSRKVSQQTFDTLQGTVNTQSTQINQNKADIQARATKTEVNTLTGTVNSLDSQLKLEAGKISALNSKTDGHTTQIGSLESSFDSFNVLVGEIKGDLDEQISAFASFELQTNGILQTVQNDKADKTTVAQLADLWQQTTDLANGHTGQISNLGEQINLRLTKEQVADEILKDNQVLDTRNTNEPPSWYYTNYPKQTVRELKTIAAIGLTIAGGNYATVTTDVSWSDSSGGAVEQTAKADNGVYQRRGTGTSWSAWARVADTSNILSQINLSTEGVLIQGKNIWLDGNTKINDAVIKTAHIADLAVSGAKIANASISSAKIISLDASKITASTLSAITANTGALNVSGNLTMTTVNAGIVGAFDYTEPTSDAYAPRRFIGDIALSLNSVSFKGETRWNLPANTNYIGYTESAYGLDFFKQRVYNGVAKGELYSRIDMYNGKLEFSKDWGLWDNTSTVIGYASVTSPRVVARNALVTNRLELRPGWASFHINEAMYNGIPNLVVSAGDTGFAIRSNQAKNAEIYVGSGEGTPRVWFPRGVYDRTYSDTPNMIVTVAGTLGRAVSARKYKTDIQKELLLNSKNILQISPSSWHDKEALRKGKPPKRYYGFIADEFDELGLKEVVQYGSDGQVEGLSYDRISMYHNVILAGHERRFNEIDGELAQIKGTHANDIWQLKAEIQELKHEIQALRQSA